MLKITFQREFSENTKLSCLYVAKCLTISSTGCSIQNWIFFTSTMDQGNLIFNNKRCWPQFLMARYLIPHDKLIYFSCSRKYTTSTCWLPLLLNGQFQIKGRWNEMRFFAKMIKRILSAKDICKLFSWNQFLHE